LSGIVLSRVITTALQPYASTYSLLDGCAWIPSRQIYETLFVYVRRIWRL